MTKNDAYKYAKRYLRGKQYHQVSYVNLETKMLKDGCSEEDIKLVKDWISDWSFGRRL